MIYTVNQQHEGIELRFETKPDNKTIRQLKRKGFRWHGLNRLWYAKSTPDRIKFVNSL